MSMDYTTKESNDVLIIDFQGKLIVGPEASEFHEFIKKQIEAGIKKILVDLGGVSFMNSSGISVIIRALTSVRNAGGELYLCSSSDRIKMLLSVTRLITVINHFESRKEALLAFEEL